MRRFALAAALIASGAVSLIILAFTRPLLMALRVDRRERGISDLARERWPDLVPYDDDDPGIDVDDGPSACVNCKGRLSTDAESSYWCGCP